MRVTHVIGGRRVDSDRSGPVYHPATGEVARTVAMAGREEVDLAVRTAAQAWPAWRDTSLADRTRVMFAFRQLLRERLDDLADVISREHGKVPADAAGEVRRGLEVVEFACGIGQLLKGGHSANVSTGVDTYSLRQPLGVAAVISPFNFPAMVPLWFLPLAIACGNTAVLKPSEKDPSAANLLADWWVEAGLPPGVLNVVHGDKEAVDALLEHPQVASVSFVGSTPVARDVYQRGTAAGKRVQALGGAKNHMVVLPDADLDQAADAAVSAAYGSAGERCMAISAVVAVDPVGDDLVSRIAARAAAIRVGDGRDCDMGPLVTAAHRDRVASYIDAGVAQGADLVLDGRSVKVHGPDGGFWLGPTLFDRVRPDMTIYTDEIFGPVLCVLRAATYEDAVRLVNANPYGNGCAVFTTDGGAARRFQQEVEVGMVGINVPIPVPVAPYPFGGWKDSLFGDTHAYGTDGVHFFTRGKVVTARWPDPARRGVNLGFPPAA
ncbi:MAG TPA: CoA-acylating methylmalonate-semialdehyde dehydrogenase [Natronosporangium sp.]|nr:CoA-acylating methylmalonate-semialdehyde dehydrogenase [Natronosporangium sp.]